MKWEGEFHIGEAWITFRGKAGDNKLHAHATLQFAFSENQAVEIENVQGDVFSQTGLLVRAGVPHALRKINSVTLIFIEPQSVLADHIIQQSGPEKITTVSKAFMNALDTEGPLSTILSALQKSLVGTDVSIDSRLETALNFLSEAPLAGAISAAAQHSGLSESRLRAIAKSQLGIPLSKWLSWRTLRRSGLVLREGGSFADAAYAGGFADQAHFTRTMVKLMGITPSEAFAPQAPRKM